jgi:hypothetical protein
MSDNKMAKTIFRRRVSVLLILMCYVSLLQSTPVFCRNENLVQTEHSDNKLLLNGRIWRNQYQRAMNDPYYLTGAFLKGSVTIKGRRFDNLDIKYDIANDEVILSVESHPIIIMNKEMVDSFSFRFNERIYRIINTGQDSFTNVKGYINVLYNGPSALYVKFSKKLQPLAVDGRLDLFVDELHIYLSRGNELIPVAGSDQLLHLLNDKKKEIADYLNHNKLKLVRKDPWSFIPVLRFYDSLK